MSLGKKLAALRREANMTQQELGEFLAISPQAVSKWENDLAEPDLATLRKLAALYHVSLDTLLDVEKPEGTVAEETPAPEPVPVLSKETEEQIRELNDFAGTCTECGMRVSRDEIGEETPKLICAKCVRARKEMERREHASHMHKMRVRRNCSFIFGGIAAALVILFTILGENNAGVLSPGLVVADVAFGYAAFALVSAFFLDNVAVDIFVWMVTRTVKFPGVIFTLDLDGIFFLITVKILFGFLSFLFGLLFAVLGVALAAPIAAVIYPFQMPRFCYKIAKGIED